MAIDYREVLDDLVIRRADLDSAISAIESLIGKPAKNGNNGHSNGSAPKLRIAKPKPEAGEGPGRGRKMCPHCHQHNGVRAKRCQHCMEAFSGAA
jgi:hypothetical protein